jgi:copper chaperone CopZ
MAMKPIFLGIFSLIAFSTISFAQTKAVQKAAIQTPGVQDEACKTRIDNFLAHEYGVTSVKADYRRHTVTVQWLKDRTNIENIKTALANMGYDADDVTADPDAYNRLPIACRHKGLNKDPEKNK